MVLLIYLIYYEIIKQYNKYRNNMNGKIIFVMYYNIIFYNLYST